MPVPLISVLFSSVLMNHATFFGSFPPKLPIAIVFFITFIVFLTKIFNAIKKQKAGYTKAIFKLVVSMITLYVIYTITTYIQINFEQLGILILWTIFGRLLGFAFELIAVKIDKVYLEEIGVV